MKKRVITVGFSVLLVGLAFIITPTASYADDYFEEHTDYVDKKNKFLSYGCKPKIDFICETQSEDPELD